MAAFIASRYEALEVVGQGAQGQVLRVLDHRHHRQVALKVRSVGPGDDGAALVAEAGILLGLDAHPGLPVVREDFFDRGRYCIVMDWVDGVTLANRLGQAGGALGLEEVLGHLAQVAEALDHLHAHDPAVVHGDVKPANILVTAERAVLVDFGISRRGWGPGPALGGTRGYQAPELGLGGIPTPAADVFSLAATAFALLTGEPPHPGSRPPWRRIAGDRARQVEFALRRGLAVDPTRRPASAGALVAALAPGASPPTNLPLELTSFVGRRALLDDLGTALGPGRLVTLSGAGGVGKSRLARQLAAEAAPDFPDGAYLAELAPLAEPALVPEQVLAAVGARQQAAQTPTETLVDVLMTRRLLLVLDNCEHLLGACAELVEVLRESCPGVALVATTRQPLGVGAEDLYLLSPLQTPGEAESDLQALAGVEAVQLFVDRAAQVKADFALTPSNAAAVGSVCRRLDGIPLALELAAARVNLLSVPQIARRLDDRFRLLAGGPRTALARHQTLRATLEWSYDALSPTQRLLFARLSVFAGGFELDAATQVCAGEAVAPGEIPELVAALVERSLVVADTDVDTPRFSLLETMRQFGAERLADSGDADRLKARHVAWALAVKEAFDAAFDRSDSEAWMHRVDTEVDNIREALGYTLTAEPETALRLITGLGYQYFANRGLIAEGRRWLDVALAANPDAPAELRGRALGGAGSAALLQGELNDAQTLLTQSVAVRRPLGRTAGLALSLNRLGRVRSSQAEFPEARRLLEESLDIYLELGDEAVDTRTFLGVVLALQGDDQQARLILEDAIAICRRRCDDPTQQPVRAWATGVGGMGDEGKAVICQMNLGYFLLLQGDLGAAALLDETLPFYRRHWAGRVAEGLGIVAEAALYRGDVRRAQALFEEQLESSSVRQMHQCAAEALGGLGRLALRRGDPVAAERLFIEALRHSAPQGSLSLAMDLERLAASAAARGSYQRAAELLGAVEAYRETRSYPRPLLYRPEYDESLAAIGEHLDPKMFQEAWANGRSMSTAQAVAHALGEERDEVESGPVLSATLG